MTDSESKANKLMQDAEKKSKGTGGFFGSLMGGSNRVDEACEMYVRAANLYKMAKNWHQAGTAFAKSAELNIQKGDVKHEAASNYVDAANCFRKTNAKASVDCLMQAVEIYTDMGRFTMAAKHHTAIAEMYESDCPDLDKAMFHYEKAADYYQGEESKSSANKCLLKVAQYAATLENYTKAIQIFEEVGASAADNSLLKYSAKDYFFKALLCHLCVDLLNAQHAVKKYDEMHPAFTDTRECKLIKDLILCIEEQNLDQFTDTVKQYDKISRLDPWVTTLLLRIKKTCGGSVTVLVCQFRTAIPFFVSNNSF